MTKDKYDISPKDWYCTREKGHGGPCTAKRVKTRLDREMEHQVIHDVKLKHKF